MISIVTPAKIDDKAQLGWLRVAIESVLAQSYDDWEMVIVNDHSRESWQPIKELFDDPRIRGIAADGDGPSVAAARNKAVAQSKGGLILPLDADDRLPENALRRFKYHWDNAGKKRGIVYSQIKMFDAHVSRLYEPPEYDFAVLLKHTFMTVGCLHRRSDWEKIGGWSTDFDHGLEDWEYWIRMGAAGICGYRANEVLYHYRRHTRGRLAKLKETKTFWNAAHQSVRHLHMKLYRGDWPMGCCGGNRSALGSFKAAHTGVKWDRGYKRNGSDDGDVDVRYTGNRGGGFGIQGPSGTRYRVPGKGGTFTAKAIDAEFFGRYNHGRDFRIAG
jgi:glycosyltransferase involved in cell wall biosynthesis